MVLTYASHHRCPDGRASRGCRRRHGGIDVTERWSPTPHPPSTSKVERGRMVADPRSPRAFDDSTAGRPPVRCTLRRKRPWGKRLGRPPDGSLRASLKAKSAARVKTLRTDQRRRPTHQLRPSAGGPAAGGGQRSEVRRPGIGARSWGICAGINPLHHRWRGGFR